MIKFKTLAFALAAVIVASGVPASAAPAIKTEAQNELFACEESTCNQIAELTYSHDGKSAYGVFTRQFTLSDGSGSYKNTLVKFNLATKAMTTLSDEYGCDKENDSWQPGETRICTDIRTIIPSMDGKFVLYTEGRGSTVLDYFDPKKGPITKSDTWETQVKLMTISTGAVEDLSTALGGNYIDEFSWGLSSKTINFIYSDPKDGYRSAVLTLATGKVTKSTNQNFINSVSRNGKFATVGNAGLFKLKTFATGKTKSVPNISTFHDHIITLNDGKNVIVYVDGVGLCVFDNSGKKVVLVPQVGLIKNVFSYSLAPNEKSLLVVLNNDEFGSSASNGYSIIPVKLPK